MIKKLYHNNMRLLTTRTISIILLVWAILFVALVAWKHWYTKPPALPPQPLEEESLPFAFDEPTEEELREIQTEQEETDNTITVPITGPIAVFKCPQKTCAVLGEFPAGAEVRIRIEDLTNAEEWLPVVWTDARQGPKQGFVLVDDLQKNAAEAPLAPSNSVDIDSLQLTPATPIPINPQTLVGIACEFADPDNPGNARVMRGSGAIISPEGHIITARSVVDLEYLNDGFENFALQRCLVGQMPSKEPLPSIDAIKKINAFVRIPYLAYTAEIAYIPPDEGLSEYEIAWLDFAIMKIDGVNPDAQYFGGPIALPDEFPVIPFLISDLPQPNDLILNFSFPSGTTIGHYADIRTLFMQGLISNITNYWMGDKRYADDLFLIEARYDTGDTGFGKFGSAVIWKGYVIGIHTTKQQESLQIYNVSAKAILENLFDNEIAIQLEVE